MRKTRRTKRNQDIRKLYNEGIEADKLAAIYGMTRRNIYNIIKQKEASL